MTSLAYGLDVPYEVQLNHVTALSTTHMSILSAQRTPGKPVTQHFLTPGVYMVSLTYNGSQSATLEHVGNGPTNTASVPTGTAGVPRTSAPIKISVHNDSEYLQVEASSSGGTARATISVIPAATFDEMAESTQGVSVLSEISNLKSTKADKSTLDARVPANTSLRLNTTVGTRIFAGNTMIYGDTGWIDMTSVFAEGLSLENTGTINVRRTDRTLDMSFSRIKLLEGSALLTLGTLPEGFRPSQRHFTNSVSIANSAALLQNISIDVSGRVWWLSQSNIGTSNSHELERPAENLQGGLSVPASGWPSSLP